MVVVKQVYTKPGATFTSGEEAYADKNSLYPAELTQKLNEFKSLARAKGILIEDEQFAWDQSAHTLTITRNVVDNDVFVAEITDFDPTFVSSIFEEYANQAGWTKVNTIIE